MGILGALVGGSVGFVVGGPLGAILLGALGAEFGDRLRMMEAPAFGGGETVGAGARAGAAGGWTASGRAARPQSRPRPGRGTPAYAPDEAEQIFLIALISLAAKVAKADGQVTENEVRSFDAFLRDQLQMDADERRMAARIFNQARDSFIPAEQFARHIAAVAGAEPDRLRDLVALLVKVALADGRIAPQEERLIRSVTLAMGLTGRDYESAVAMFGAGSLDSAYRVIGVDPEATDEDIKRAYRRLAKEYHPDTLVAKSVGSELQAFGREKMVAINDAYHRLREARGF